MKRWTRLSLTACLREPCPSAWRNQHIPSLRLAIPGDICKIRVFNFLNSSPSPFYKKHDIQTPTWWLFCDISLPSSPSASFPNKVTLLASIPHLSRLTGLSCSEQMVPGSGRSPGEGNGNPLWYSCLGNLWTEEPGGLQSMGLQVGHDLATKPPSPVHPCNGKLFRNEMSY